MLCIPAGFGHGFPALTQDASLAYKVTDYYSSPGERTILWNDAELGISWPVAPERAIISDRDRMGTAFSAAEVFP